jgi:hypothetical protein
MPSSRSVHLVLALLIAPGFGATAACSGSSASDAIDGSAQTGDSGQQPSPDGSGAEGGSTDGSSANDGPSDGGTTVPSDGSLPFTCTAPPSPNPCPAPTGADNQASFCFRPRWAGATKVEVYLSKTGQQSDWSSPFTTLTSDSSGMFSGSASLPNGSYPYVFRVYGSADGLVKDGIYLEDPENPNFQKYLPGGPTGTRSLSVITIPQSTTPFPTYQVTGELTYQGAPQPCYSVDLEIGELDDGGTVLSEHGTGNYTETQSDGTYSFTVANGPIGITIRYPFGLSGSYPNPLTTPSLGTTRTNTAVAGADLAMPTADIAYPLADYAAMMPAPGATSALPVTFQFTLIPGASLAKVSVTSTNVAGDDPSFWSAASSATSVTWDGGFGGGDAGKGAEAGTTYYWGTWPWPAADAAAPAWVSESLLFPIEIN